MVPVVFNQCFGWLHDASGSTGVVMCNPYGHEAILAHRGWRGIAEHLASTGTPVLRFDYRGTGDSDESEGDGDRLDAWVESIRDAARFLRENTPVQRVVLCGVRLGAMLAVMAASAECAIDGLVLLAPVISGREYLRELKLMQRHWRNSAAAHIPAEDNVAGHVEALGFRLYPPSIARLASANLLIQAAPVVPRVLILDSLNGLAIRRLCEHYRLSGIDVEMHDFPDYPRLIGEANYARPPLLTCAALTTWMATFDAPASPLPQGAFADPKGAARTADPSCLAAAALKSVAERAERGCVPATLTGDGFIETAVHFDGGRLFGIYCQPGQRSAVLLQGGNGGAVASTSSTSSLRESIIAQGGDVSRHGVLFANTAASHHIGESRMWVEQARNLARQGVASLRMDVGLIGESRCAAASMSDADQHADQSVTDVMLGIDFLFDKGHTLPNAIGICSGAYLVMKAALANTRLRGALLINQRAYVLTSGLVERTGTEPIVASSAVYLQSLRSPEKWHRLFAGEIPFATITKALLIRRVAQWRRAATYVLDALTGRDSDRTLVRRNFKLLEKRGVRLHIAYGDLDVGLEEARLFFARDLQWLRKLRHVTADIERALDHGLFLYPARALLQRWIEEQIIELEMARVSRMRSAGHVSSVLKDPRSQHSVSRPNDT